MVAWSGLLRSTGQILLRGSRIVPKNIPKNGAIQVRLMSGHGERRMVVTPSRWQWYKTKDILHMYALIGFAPCLLIIFLSHVFVGPATLTEIPEGYTPKHWEYYRDPISRFIARYIYTSPQQEYEKYLHMAWTESEIIKIRKLEKQIDQLMFDRKDYQAWYYQPYEGKYARRELQVEDGLEEIIKGED